MNVFARKLSLSRHRFEFCKILRHGRYNRLEKELDGMLIWLKIWKCMSIDLNIEEWNDNIGKKKEPHKTYSQIVKDVEKRMTNNNK